MKKIIYCLIISAFIMFVLPWIDVALVPNDAGMITTIVLLFVVNPLYSIAVGMFAGKNMVVASCYCYIFLSRSMDIF